MIDMAKNLNSRRTEKLLKELELYKSSLDYFSKIRGCSEIPVSQYRSIHSKIKFLTHTIAAVEHATTLLGATEYDVISKLYFNKDMTFDDVCESCALERSSIYRYRASALKKMSIALFGAE